jgi:hypothetical protein
MKRSKKPNVSENYMSKSPFTNEQHIGLAERRQRKRVKRDIMKPPPSPEKENNEDHPTKVNRKTGKGSATRKKAQAGFALMHGLFATNVGKNRLTVCLDLPRSSIGRG